MDTELRMARLIEDAEFDGSVVAPGTRFTFTDLDNDTRTTYRLLGPWDCTEDDILNYRAPIAITSIFRIERSDEHGSRVHPRRRRPPIIARPNSARPPGAGISHSTSTVCPSPMIRP